MFEVREKPQMVERALLVSVYFDRRDADGAESLLEELEELVGTLGIDGDRAAAGVLPRATPEIPLRHRQGGRGGRRSPPPTSAT